VSIEYRTKLDTAENAHSFAKNLHFCIFLIKLAKIKDVLLWVIDQLSAVTYYEIKSLSFAVWTCVVCSAGKLRVTTSKVLTVLCQRGGCVGPGPVVCQCLYDDVWSQRPREKKTGWCWRRCRSSQTTTGCVCHSHSLCDFFALRLMSKGLISGTVYLLSCELQTFHRPYWKLICSTPCNWFSTFAAPFLSCIATCKLSTV